MGPQKLSSLVLGVCLTSIWSTVHSFDCTQKDGFYADPASCTKFYRCVWNRAYSYTCPSGTFFSPSMGVCDWSWNVPCPDGRPPSSSSSDATTTSPTTTTTTTSSATTVTTTTGRASATGSNLSPAVVVEVTCTGRPSGAMFRAPQDCSQYYWCVNGEPVLRPCPSGLHFNNADSSCDWPSNVDCGDNTGPIGGATTAATAATRQPTVGVEIETTARQSTDGVVRTTETTTRQSTAGVERTTATTSTGESPSGSGSGCARRVCYYTNWAQYRLNGGKYLPENVDPHLCSHAIYAFAKLSGNHLAAFEWNDESTPWMKGMYERFNDMKRGTNMKTLLAVGGWNMGSEPFTRMVATQQSRQEFADQSLTFLKSHGFDGLDLDWEYPANRGSPPGDRGKFTQLIKQLRETYDRDAANNGGSPLLLTAAVAAGKSTIDTGYDVAEISKHLDFINLMSYDFHGSWESKTGLHNGLYKYTGETPPESYLNTDWAARYWVSLGCPKHKLVVGIPTYGRTFTLSSSSDTGVGAPASGAGSAGTFTREKGFLSYYEVCAMQATGEVHYVKSQRANYLVSGNQWVGYDDTHTVREKVRYVKHNGYGGVMTWALDLDDFTGTTCREGKYPLLSAMNDECSR